MEILVFIFSIIALVYFSNILWLIMGFSKIKNFEVSEIIPKTKFTIIVPFRNEDENLPKLLDSISMLDYPMNLFEVILVDDASDFRFQILDFRFQISLIDNLRSSNSPKKDAINSGITIAKNDWIITTDADCVVQPKWLKTFDNYIQENNPKMIAAGVFYKTKGSFLDYFQQLDLLSLQGTTIGSFGNDNTFMCNGANFCYQRSFFYELNGFDGNSNIASGDDVFLLQKAITNYPEVVRFLKSEMAIVETQTMKTWRDLFFQRVRWASKTANYTSFYAKQLGLSVFLMNLFWVLDFGFWISSSSGYWYFLLFFWIKFIIDFILLNKTARFFKIRLKDILFCSLVYPLFSVLVVLYSIFGKYEWKGRQFKK
ncbi:glycosyltransferase [Flavobacterium sp.]|uniref:glycosyltransferase family 2 protein n=1 Tax=Flavobacterium sp. TaxID=239 RepID=UPI003751CDF6